MLSKATLLRFLAAVLLTTLFGGNHVADAAQPGRLQTIALHSPALGGDTGVNVLLPTGYSSGARRYPVLYLLHGYDGSYQNWVKETDIISFTRALPLIVVMPDGDSGWYMDPVQPGPAWETYHIHELIPYIDAHYRTIASRNGRVIAGLSMGGMGAIGYAARHPDLFAAAASFSGVLDPEHFTSSVNGVEVGADTIFGAICYGSVWCLRAHDPLLLAGNLSGVRLFLSCGTGNPGPLDRPGTAVDQLEAHLHGMLLGMAAALKSAGVPATVEDYGAGTHSWPYWQRELHHAMPLLVAALFGSSSAPADWRYRTADTSAEVWGYTLRVDRQAGNAGFTDIGNVNRAGFSLSGTGSVTVTTAAVYVSGRLYAVHGADEQVRHVLADRTGRLQLTVQLGSREDTRHVQIDI